MEASTLIGISIYSIVVKPYVNLLDKLNDRKTKDHIFPQITFMKEVCKNIFKAWLEVEYNYTLKMKEMIGEFLMNKTIYDKQN